MHFTWICLYFDWIFASIGWSLIKVWFDLYNLCLCFDSEFAKNQ